MKYTEVIGNLITLAQAGKYDVIAHGCNCYCLMGAGIAPQMAQVFGADKFTMEGREYRGDINKLGCIDFEDCLIAAGGWLTVVNAYTQYDLGSNHVEKPIAPIDYEALTLCMRKINHTFKGQVIGLPQIGAGLAGGDWDRIKVIIQRELRDCDVVVVIYDGAKPSATTKLDKLINDKIK